jgi:hypothetical protein
MKKSFLIHTTMGRLAGWNKKLVESMCFTCTPLCVAFFDFPLPGEQSSLVFVIRSPVLLIVKRGERMVEGLEN